jgi:hypothetical protein
MYFCSISLAVFLASKCSVCTRGVDQVLARSWAPCVELCWRVCVLRCSPCLAALVVSSHSARRAVVLCSGSAVVKRTPCVVLLLVCCTIGVSRLALVDVSSRAVFVCTRRPPPPSVSVHLVVALRMCVDHRARISRDNPNPNLPLSCVVSTTPTDSSLPATPSSQSSLSHVCDIVQHIGRHATIAARRSGWVSHRQLLL